MQEQNYVWNWYSSKKSKHKYESWMENETRSTNKETTRTSLSTEEGKIHKDTKEWKK